MTTVDRDPEFRARLIADYQAGDLGVADLAVCMAATTPEQILTTPERCRAMLFCLELWAACCRQPHPALRHVEIDYMQWPRQRMASDSNQAVTALFWLSQSPFGAEFAEDTHQLRPRLFAAVQKEALARSRITTLGTLET